MSEERGKRDFSTVDLRKNLGKALGRAHYQGEVVRISHHGKPYAAVVSEEDASLLEQVKQLGLKERLRELLDGGKGLDDLVEQFERTKDEQGKAPDVGSRRRTADRNESAAPSTSRRRHGYVHT